MVVGLGGYILAGGGWWWILVGRGGSWWIYFGWWWVVLDVSGWGWVVVSGGIVQSNPCNIKKPTVWCISAKKNYYNLTK